MTFLSTDRRTRHRGRRASLAAPGALLLAVLATFVGQANPAAAAAPPAATSSASPTAAPTTTPAPAPAAAPTAGPTGAPTVDPKAAQEKAAREVQQADPAGPCPATLDPGVVTTCTVDSYKSATFSLTLPTQDLVYFQTVGVNYSAYPKLTAPDGTAVACDTFVTVMRCATTQQGTYKLDVVNGNFQASGISVSYLPVLTSTCKTVDPTDRTLGAPKAFHGSMPTAWAGDCYTVDLAPGDMLRTFAGLRSQRVVDATGKEVCAVSGLDTTLYCRLAGTAPYRVVVQSTYGDAQTYDLTLARLSSPEGCLTVEPQAFGTAPDLVVARCRILHVTDAGWYSFSEVTASGETISGPLYQADGSTVANCGQLSRLCNLAPGSYTWADAGQAVTAGPFGTVFHSAKETRGCTAAADDDLVSGPVTGTFGTAGQALCLTLPTATGNGLYLINRVPTDGTSADVAVYDAAGTFQCDNSNPAIPCKLTGTAPFRAVVTGAPGKAFSLAIHRTGETAGCTAWPQSGFDGTWGAEAALTANVKQACFALPAGQHSTSELLDYTNTANQTNASLQVIDQQGNVVCSTAGSSTFTCRLAAGVPYTALLTNSTWGDSYKLVRRDFSPTANCLTPDSTAVGGQSVQLDLGSALDARCVRVSAAATDKFWLSVRTATVGNGYQGTAVPLVIDANGKTVCGVNGSYCKVTGSTSYTMAVLASGYRGQNIHAAVDTWKVGTPDGWAPECTSHPISVQGFPLRSGLLTESSTGYCAVVDMKASQSLNVVGTSSATNLAQPLLTLLGPATWEEYDSTYQCSANYGEFGARCQSLNNAVPGKAVLLLSPGNTVMPVEYSMQAACDYPTCTNPPRPSLIAINGTTGAAGTQTQIEIRGTNLTLGTKVKFGGSTYPMRPVSVSPDGTSLHVMADTNGMTPGTYDVVLDGIGYTTGVPSPNYFPKAFTVTAAAPATKGRLVPLTPNRILNTVSGVGAPAGRLGQGGVLSLQVAGVAGVPTTGVTSVVMNVTAVNPSSNSAVSVYPSGQKVPDLPTVSFAAGQIVTNLVTVPLANGKVDIRNAWGDVDLGVDILGYYTDSGAGSLLRPVTPSRILNTVWGVGAPAGRVHGGGVVPLKVAGVGGVPTTGVTAVVMNVTAVNPSQTSYLTVYPDGLPVPDASAVNFAAGQNVTNLVTVPVVNGVVDIRNAWGDVDLGVDIMGYYTDSGSTYTASPLVRLMDTRDGEGVRVGSLGGSNDQVSLRVAGVEGMPATGVTAVVMNVTAVWPTDTSFLTVFPHGTARPDASSINYRPGQVVSALVVAPVVDGRVSFVNQWGSTDVVADLVGYFSS
ncbi:hypothetical protein PUR71_20945 [Streptomyces sp. SP17BM10]|uniref:hypothetical protein n=1 Tax=Streptomyces sp. SP17BM10 TaxID=3002530 RepID=UPI002E788967|nr:hypothetical protein [Streptomyces sp. SP17BM10]MEE1785360.1 hypothetical protein [Streptomyces sp. SP17BM10]